MRQQIVEWDTKDVRGVLLRHIANVGQQIVEWDTNEVRGLLLRHTANVGQHMHGVVGS